MKNEDEIRRRIATLKTCLAIPCTCDKSGHSQKCAGGAYMMLAAIMELSWALGEEPDYEPRVAEMEEMAATWRAGQN